MPMERKDFVLTSSSLDRLEQCPASGAFRQTTKEKPSFPQWYGIFVHRFLQYAVEKGRAAALAYVYTKKMKGVHAVCEKIDTDALPPGRCEVSLAHDVVRDSGRLVLSGRTSDCDPETEQFGKADLIGEYRDMPLIVDYKTGDISGQDPAEHSQLLGLAAALRGDLVEVPGVALALAQVKASGQIDWAISCINNARLNRHAERARRVQLAVLSTRKALDAGAPQVFVAGPECTYCELRPDCPKHRYSFHVPENSP